MKKHHIFDLFLRTQGYALRRSVERMTGCSEVDDLLQQILLKIHKGCRHYRDVGRFKAWAFTIADNTCIDFLRKRKLKLVSQDEPLIETTPEKSLEATESRDMILRAISRLPFEQRRVFLLKEEADLSFKEIAKVTDAPLGTVLARMHYAIKRLREVLNQYVVQ